MALNVKLIEQLVTTGMFGPRMIPTGGPIKYYGVFAEDGSTRGFWTSDTFPAQENGDRNAAIPTEAVEITQDEWYELINNQATARYINGEIVYVEPPPPPEPEPNPTWVEAERANTRLDAGVDAAIEGANEVRSRLSSPPPHSNPPTVEELQAQIDYLAAETKRLADSYIAMLGAQNG